MRSMLLSREQYRIWPMHADPAFGEAASKETASPRPTYDHDPLGPHQNHVVSFEEYNKPICEVRSFLTSLWSSRSSLALSRAWSLLSNVRSTTSGPTSLRSFALPLMSNLSWSNESVTHARDDRLLTRPRQHENVKQTWMVEHTICVL